MAVALIYPDGGKQAPGRKDPGATAADSASVSMKRVRDARQIVRHADLVEQVKSGYGVSAIRPRAGSICESLSSNAFSKRTDRLAVEKIKTSLSDGPSIPNIST
jgi:hypothetical protein